MPNEVKRPYIISEQQTRLLYVLSSMGMIAVLVALLVLTSSRPRGEFETSLDRTQYLSTLEEATQSLEGYKENADGSVSIPIEQAMELIVERGVVNPFE